MSQRKVWSEKEDHALKDIIVNKKISKWSAISKIMEKDYGIPGRTGKQCRQRWHNQLDSTINKADWTEEEEKILFRQHDVYGNKWAKIAADLPGRTDNAIKNHFYSTLRKSVRRLNRYVSECKSKGEMKEIKPIMLSKVISVADEILQTRLGVSDDLIYDCIDIKHRLIQYAKELVLTADQQQELSRLVIDIVNFNKNYKRNRNKTAGSEQDQDEEQSNMQEDDLKVEEQESSKSKMRKTRQSVKSTRKSHFAVSSGANSNNNSEAARNLTVNTTNENTSRNYPKITRTSSMIETESPTLKKSIILTAPASRQNNNKQLKPNQIPLAQTSSNGLSSTQLPTAAQHNNGETAFKRLPSKANEGFMKTTYSGDFQDDLNIKLATQSQDSLCLGAQFLVRGMSESQFDPIQPFGTNIIQTPSQGNLQGTIFAGYSQDFFGSKTIPEHLLEPLDARDNGVQRTGSYGMGNQVAFAQNAATTSLFGFNSQGSTQNLLGANGIQPTSSLS